MVTASGPSSASSDGSAAPLGRPDRARAARGRRRAVTIATGLALTVLGASVALTGVAASAYAGGWQASTPTAALVAQSTLALEHDRTLSYPLEQVWPATLRYIRVDRGYTLVDRDAEAGYVLFDFPLGRPGDVEAGVARGSIEMFATQDMSGRPAVRVRVRTDAGPSHLPHAIAEGLAVKLKRERGNPSAPPPKTPTPPPPADPDPDDGTVPLVDPPLDP